MITSFIFLKFWFIPFKLLLKILDDVELFQRHMEK